MQTVLWSGINKKCSASWFYKVPRASTSLAWKENLRILTAPSNKTPAIRKSTNMGVWAVGTLNQLFIRGS